MRTAASLITLLVAVGCKSAPPPAAPSPPSDDTVGAAEPEPTAPPSEPTQDQEPLPPPPSITSWTLHAIDVGTGLSIFVKGPDFSLLYDAGSNDDRAQGDSNRVLAYLKAVDPNISKIDHVLVGHAHEDHVSLMPDVLTTLEIGTVYDSGRMHPICSYRRVLDAVEATPTISYRTVKHPKGAGTVDFKQINNCAGKAKQPKKTYKFNFAEQLALNSVVQLGVNASMKFLHANANDKKPTGGELSPNDNSLVVLLTLGPNKILLTGDIEAGERKTWPKEPSPKSAEGEILACCAADLDADVLISAHHGSKTSSRTKFVDAVSPKIVVVSSGPHKYSGTSLPDADVVKAYEAAGAKVLTTKPDADEVACKTNAAKIGPDNDGKPGGCDNWQLTFTSAGDDVATKLWTMAD